MLIGIIIGITLCYITVMVCLCLTSAMPDLPDVEEISYE